MKAMKVHMKNLGGGCGLNRMDGESNESAYEKFSLSFESEEMNCGVVEVVKHSTLRWSGKLERTEDKMTKRIYKSEVAVVDMRGRPPIKWEDRGSEYLKERGNRRLRGMESARVECMDRSK